MILLGFRAPLQVDADFSEDELRERRAIEYQFRCVADSVGVANFAHITFGDVHDVAALRAACDGSAWAWTWAWTAPIRIFICCGDVPAIALLIYNVQPVGVRLPDDVYHLSSPDHANDAGVRARSDAKIHSVSDLRLIADRRGSLRNKMGLSDADGSESDGGAQAESHHMFKNRLWCCHVNPSMDDWSAITIAHQLAAHSFPRENNDRRDEQNHYL